VCESLRLLAGCSAQAGMLLFAALALCGSMWVGGLC
jgi:hypothetical protein